METRKGWGVVIGASIFAIVVIGAAGATYFIENKGALPFLTTAKSDNPNDEDGDGLFTWEEAAWHTDPKKPDTDGDGASDGAEVAAGSNPALAGAGENPYEAWGGSSPTDGFAQNIVAAQIAYQAAGGAPNALQTIGKSTASKVQLPDLEEEIPYSALKIATSTDIRQYGELVVRILEQSLSVRKDELAVFKRTVDSGNFLGTQELKQDATLYRSIEAALLAIQVPQVAATAHLKLVNSIGTLANTVQAMASWGGDPIAGIAYMDSYLKMQARLKTDITSLFTLLSNTLTK